MDLLFNKLESNSNEESDSAKNEILTQFNAIKEPWMINGLIDYYCQTDSARVVDLLVKVHQPHDLFIFDKIHKLLRESPKSKKIALTLFSQIIRKHPTWIFKILDHHLMKELIKILKNEKDVVIYMLALMCLISLLPIIPASIGKMILDLFEVFSYLAVWISNNTTNLPECHLIQLQYSLCTLFKRLYGMFPVNFFEFMKQEYVYTKDPHKAAVFNQVIGPMLENIRCHPFLLTANKINELAPARWKKMEPHDVVMECARYAIENDRNYTTNGGRIGFDYSSYISMKTSDFFNCNASLVDVRPIPNAKTIENKFENIWSPSHVIMATPSTVPNTPTPTPIQNYNIPSMNSQHHQSMGIEGSSPPTEAAVEATPETTPMKPENRRPYPVTSTAARAIWPKSGSQPSSPLKKLDIQFPSSSNNEQQQHFETASSQKLIRLVSDRHQVQIQMPDLSSDMSHLKITPTTSPLITGNGQESLSFDSVNSSGKDEQESNDNNQLLDADNDEDDDPDITLVNPDVYQRFSFVRRVKRLRMVSHCLGEYSSSYSAGTSPADVSYIATVGINRLKRFYSWPDLKKVKSDIEVSTRKNNTSSSPSEEAVSAHSHFKQEKKLAKTKIEKKNLYKEIRADLNVHCWEVEKKDSACQTIQMWPQVYDVMFYDLFSEENQLDYSNVNQKPAVIPTTTTTTTTTASTKSGNNGSVKEIAKITPNDIVDQYMEACLKKRSANDVQNDIELLRILLEYERYRREIHAERNRRLLPKSRMIRQLEQSNETLKEQCRRLESDIEVHNRTSAELRRKFQMQIDDLNRENQNLKNVWLKESEINQGLKRQLDENQFRLDEEIANKKQSTQKIEQLNAQIFDLRNELDKAKQEADLGKQYRDELNRLQCEMIILNEARIKCSQKLSELDNLKARDMEFETMEQTYLEENRDLRKMLELKTSQADTFRAKLLELESQVQKRDLSLSELKRSEQVIKDQYEERLNALEEKYATQKAIIVKMEEHILELNKNTSAVNQFATSPESDRTDLVGSLDHTSPLSLSIASSLDGLSTSLRSTHELRNLQSLIANPSAAGSSSSVITPSTNMNENNAEKNGKNVS